MRLFVSCLILPTHKISHSELTLLVAVVSLLADWGLAALLSSREQAAAERALQRLLSDRLARYRVDYVSKGHATPHLRPVRTRTDLREVA
jgi:hypothetical protein